MVPPHGIFSLTGRRARLASAAMFTGIVTECGTLRSFEQAGGGYRMVINASQIPKDLAIGDSVAVNGCCLTAVAFDAASISFDLLAESVRLTTFANIQVGDRLNLEPSLPANGKLGGHFVTGHVDALAEVIHSESKGKDRLLRFQPPVSFMPFITYKGSVALNGVSLTVAARHPQSFDVWLIPHTLEVTNLGTLKSGMQVNLETDILAKYVIQAAENLPSAPLPQS